MLSETHETEKSILGTIYLILNKNHESFSEAFLVTREGIKVKTFSCFFKKKDTWKITLLHCWLMWRRSRSQLELIIIPTNPVSSHHSWNSTIVLSEGISHRPAESRQELPDKSLPLGLPLIHFNIYRTERDNSNFKNCLFANALRGAQSQWEANIVGGENCLRVKNTRGVHHTGKAFVN